MGRGALQVSLAAQSKGPLWCRLLNSVFYGQFNTPPHTCQMETHSSKWTQEQQECSKILLKSTPFLPDAPLPTCLNPTQSTQLRLHNRQLEIGHSHVPPINPSVAPAHQTAFHFTMSPDCSNTQPSVRSTGQHHLRTLHFLGPPRPKCFLSTSFQFWFLCAFAYNQSEGMNFTTND